MADYFSLPNAEELIAKMRDYADTAEDIIYGICVNTPNVLRQAADAIEALMQENAKLKAERDAAVADIPKHCGTCKRFFKHDPCLDDANSCRWEWRGVKEKEDD